MHVVERGTRLCNHRGVIPRPYWGRYEWPEPDLARPLEGRTEDGPDKG